MRFLVDYMALMLLTTTKQNTNVKKMLKAKKSLQKSCTIQKKALPLQCN